MTEPKLAGVRAMAATASIALHAAAVAAALAISRAPMRDEPSAVVQVVVVHTAPPARRTALAHVSAPRTLRPTTAQPSTTPTPAPPPGAPPPAEPASGVQAIDKGQILDPYAADVWHRLAAYRPRGVRGAGAARIVFGLDTNGRVRFARVAASSGSPAFDHACLNAIYAAAPYPAPPIALTEADLVFAAPIENSRDS
jgi:TonB family protein